MRKCDQCTHWLKIVQLSGSTTSPSSLSPPPGFGPLRSAGFLQWSPQGSLSLWAYLTSVLYAETAKNDLFF